MNPDTDPLRILLARLQLTALRDRLDSLLDEAARRELNLREALTFLCQAEVAHHALGVGRRQRVIDPAHLAGVVGAPAEGGAASHAPPAADRSPAPVLLRPLAEYEAIAGGGW